MAWRTKAPSWILQLGQKPLHQKYSMHIYIISWLHLYVISDQESDNIIYSRLINYICNCKLSVATHLVFNYSSHLTRVRKLSVVCMSFKGFFLWIRERYLDGQTVAKRSRCLNSIILPRSVQLTSVPVFTSTNLITSQGTDCSILTLIRCDGQLNTWLGATFCIYHCETFCRSRWV